MSKLISIIKNLFAAKPAAEAADLLTDGVLRIFNEAADGLEKANELYDVAEENLTEQIVDMLDLVEVARADRNSVTAARAANEVRISKLREFI